MNPLFNRNLLVVTTLFGLALVACMFAWDFSSNDPRMADNVISTGEFNWWETFIILVGIPSILLVWVYSFKHAFSNGRRKWGVLIFMLWPLAFFYAWFIADAVIDSSRESG